MAPNRSLSTQEVAELLHVSKSTIYELIRRGEINSYKVGRKVRFTQDDVDAYIARSRHEQSVQPVRRVTVTSDLLHAGEKSFNVPYVMRKETLETEGAASVLNILRSAPFKKEVLHFTGNDYRDMGKIIAEV